MENHTPLDKLIDQYLTGEATPQERAMLERAYQRAVLKNGPAAQGELDAGEVARVGRETWQALVARMSEARVRRMPRWRKVAAVAAAVLAVLSVSTWLYTGDRKQQAPQQSAFLNDVEPGSRGATLTLGNGQRIRLDEAARGELARETGVVIRKSDNGQLTYELTGGNTAQGRWNVLATDSGQTYRVRLPDGSLVQLNAASALEYPANFGEGLRMVKLRGEGYFEIAKDTQRPFVVETSRQEVEVLGTRFNINGYTGEPAIETVLLEGVVKVTAHGDSRLLKPGELARHDGNSIVVSPADTQQAVDWINEEFALNGVDFRTAMRKIARWYRVEVTYDESVPEDLVAGGWISRNTKLSDVLRLIEKAGQVYFKVEGREVYVFKQE